METWDIYDINRNKTNKTILRGERLANGEYHLVVSICIFNSQQQMLIQQRQPFKEGWPNMWDITAAGSAIQGETSQTAMSREVYEEIGYRIDLSNIRPHLTVNFDRGFDDFYLIEDDLDITKLRLQYEEVQQVKWATLDEILYLIDNGEFIPYYKNLIELLFQTRNNYGAHVQ